MSRSALIAASSKWLLVLLLPVSACWQTHSDYLTASPAPDAAAGKGCGTGTGCEMDAGRDAFVQNDSHLQRSPDAHLLDCPGIAEPEPGDAGNSGSTYGISIERVFATDFEAELISTAESLPASIGSAPESIAPYADEGGRCVPNGVEELSPLHDESLRSWCSHRFDCVCIPYALTCEALKYYVDVILAFRHQDFSPSGGITMETSSLTYNARVAFHERIEYEGTVFVDVRVVYLSLQWSQYCGNICALFFSKERLVIFNAEGEVEAVIGDGETDYVVS